MPNVLSKKQLAIIVFFIPLVFKMAALPALLYEESGADFYISVAIMAALEFLQLWLILFLVDRGGFEGIKRDYGITCARILAAPLLFVLGTKSVIYVTEIYTYVCDFLFYNASSAPIVVALLIAISYLGLKGAQSIGRIFELSVWLVPIIFLFGLIFGKVTLRPEYLTPVFENGILGSLNGWNKYLIYTFDFSPLLLFGVERKRGGTVIISAILCLIALLGCYALLLASYGRATFLVNISFARLASFNTVVSEVGSLDWPSAILWLLTATGNIALKFAAMAEIFKLFKVKKHIGLTLAAVVVGAISLYAFPCLKESLKVMTGAIKYVVVGLEVGIPLIMVVLFAIKRANREVKVEAQV